MCSFHVVAFICLVAAASFADSNAEENEGAPLEHSLDELHAELAEQLMMAEHAGLVGEELADRLEYHSRQLNEVERHLVDQLLEEQQASLTGQELAMMLTEQRNLQDLGVGGDCSVVGLTSESSSGALISVIEFLPAEYGLQLSFIYNGASILKKKVSVAGADGVCAHLPGRWKMVSTCLQLGNVQQEGHHFKACINLPIRVFGHPANTINMGCISI